MRRKKVLITGGCGFVGSHVTALLCDAGHDVRVYDDLSTCELGVDGGPRWLDPRASLIDWMKDEPVSACEGEVDAIVHLSLRWPLERERAVYEKAFDDWVAQGVQLLMSFRGKRLTRFVCGSTDALLASPDAWRRDPGAALCAALQSTLAYWHRPPSLGVYFLLTPELTGERRCAPFPDGVEGAPHRVEVEDAATALAALATSARHRKHSLVPLSDAVALRPEPVEDVDG